MSKRGVLCSDGTRRRVLVIVADHTAHDCRASHTVGPYLDPTPAHVRPMTIKTREVSGIVIIHPRLVAVHSQPTHLKQGLRKVVEVVPFPGFRGLRF